MTDITLPEKSGMELIKDLQAMHRKFRCWSMSMHDESLYAERVLRAGGARLHHETRRRRQSGAGRSARFRAARFT